MDKTNPFLNLMLPIQQEIAMRLGLTPQLGLININQMATGNADLERTIIDNVGSYGRQLGRLIEAMEVILDQSGIGAAPEDLSPEQQAALRDFEKLASDVRAAKLGYTHLTEENIAGFVKGIRDLRESDSEAYGELRARLLKTLEVHESG